MGCNIAILHGNSALGDFIWLHTDLLQPILDYIKPGIRFKTSRVFFRW